MLMTVTKKDLSGLEKRLDAKLEQTLDKSDFSDVMEGFMEAVDNRFVRVEAKLEGLDLRFDQILNAVDGLVKRIDTFEVELVARDAKFNRLVRWSKKVAVKVETPLENL